MAQLGLAKEGQGGGAVSTLLCSRDIKVRGAACSSGQQARVIGAVMGYYSHLEIIWSRTAAGKGVFVEVTKLHPPAYWDFSCRLLRRP